MPGQLPPGQLQRDGEELFTTRRIAGHLLFRAVDHAADASSVFFLTDAAPERGGAARADWFEAERRAGRVGRVLLHTAPYMEVGSAALLFFRPDGSGFALYETEQVTFDWGVAWKSLYATPPANALNSSLHDLRCLGEAVFVEQVNPCLQFPYICKGQRHTPLRWLRGSEDDLRRLTHAAVCTEPALFAGHSSVLITYRAATPWSAGGLFQCLHIDGHHGRAAALCGLAFRCNRFVGETWGSSRDVAVVKMTIAEPSRTERAEAYLTLANWLEDLLPPVEVRHLLAPAFASIQEIG